MDKEGFRVIQTVTEKDLAGFDDGYGIVGWCVECPNCGFFNRLVSDGDSCKDCKITFEFDESANKKVDEG